MAIETRYARTTDGTHVAYQVTGSGPVDIVAVRAWISNVEHEWEEPVLARLYRRLGTMGRLIRLDRRGSGLSDRIAHRALPTLEDRADDIRAVMDAAGSRSAVFIGLAAGSPLCVFFAATHPDRTAGLVLHEPEARGSWAADYPWGSSPEEHAASLARLPRIWGTREMAAGIIARSGPSRANDEHFIGWLADEFRLSGTAADAAALTELTYQTDVRDVLSVVRVPTLVIARAEAGAEESRAIADMIPGARYAEHPGRDHMAISGDTDAVLAEIEGFIDQLRQDADDLDRVLLTLMLTDVADSTRVAAELGDRRWAQLLEEHYAAVRPLVARYRGREIDTAGDGMLAAFDGPARAIRCAAAARDAVAALGLELRVGLHAGECEQVGDRLRGLAVHIAARVSALAERSEVLVSGTVKDLVAGSGLEFVDRGEHELKGVPGVWRIFAVQ